MDTVLEDWLGQAFDLAARHALPLAFFGAMAENTIVLGLFTPGGPVVALAAAGARAAGLPLPLVVALATAGMIGGALFDYALGRAGAHQLLRHPRTGRLGPRLAGQLDQVEPLLQRHGWWVVLLAHSWSYARTSVALGAGASRLPLRRFLLFETPAALLWSSLWSVIGYFLAANYERFEPLLQRAGWFGLAVAVLILLGNRYLLPRLRRARSGSPREVA
ncbi:MAG TPA: DedA family protein [Chloroflexota bacterium]|nr:DedA family protein [Chloroflexota bacterium]